MNTTLTELKRQHGNFAKLLGILRDELDAFNHDNSADFALMRDAMIYMTSFPDRFHHPKEDLVFQAVVAKRPDLEETASELLLEHEQILETGRHLLQELEFVTNDCIVARDSLESLGWDYVASMYRHMSTEENTLFRVAEETLEPADWARIELSASSARDPVFGPVVIDELSRLYDALVQRPDWKLAS